MIVIDLFLNQRAAEEMVLHHRRERGSALTALKQHRDGSWDRWKNGCDFLHKTYDVGLPVRHVLELLALRHSVFQQRENSKKRGE
jgi:hypothetical protein